jgi:hypothetical protein
MKSSTTGSTGRAVSDSPPERISEVLLLDGSTVSLRRLNPGDVDAITRLSETLTDEDRYYRFFTLHPGYLQTWARSLTDMSSISTRLARSSRESLSASRIMSLATPRAPQKCQSSSPTTSTYGAWVPRCFVNSDSPPDGMGYITSSQTSWRKTISCVGLWPTQAGHVLDTLTVRF